MPRISAEARGAAAFRAGSRVPEPPECLGKDAADIWRAIAASKPADWFDAGAQVLLERYCQVAIAARLLDREIEKFRKVGAKADVKVGEKHMALLDQSLATLATKLRLSVQAQVEWHSRKIAEKGAKEAEPDRLLGGAAVWGDTDGGRAN